MLAELKRAWRRLSLRRQANAPGDPGPQPESSPEQSGTRAVLAEVRQVREALSSAGRRQADLLDELRARLCEMENAREAAGRQIDMLRSSLAEALGRHEETAGRVEQLGKRLEQMRRAHEAYVQAALARERRLGRRLGWSMLVAGCALLLGALAGTATLRDSRQYAGLLAELGRDIREVRATMERQVASRPAPDPYQHAAPPAAAEREAGSVPEPPGSAPQRPDIAAAVSRYHPHSKYRTRREMQAFFEENAAEQGMISVADGLQYRVVTRGSGESPGPSDTVILDYSAFLLDGTEVFSSYDEPLPAQFGLEQLAPGLREVVGRMEEGARWEVYVSPDHAYRGGTRKRRAFGYEPLVYVVDLRSVLESGTAVE